jgi:hypothetical protein
MGTRSKSQPPPLPSWLTPWLASRWIVAGDVVRMTLLWHHVMMGVLPRTRLQVE